MLSLLYTMSLAQDGIISVRNITFTYLNLTKLDLAAGDNLTLELNLSSGFKTVIYVYNSTLNPLNFTPGYFSQSFVNNGAQSSIFTFTAILKDTYTIRLLSNTTTGRYNLTLSINGQFFDKKSSWITYENTVGFRSLTTELKPIMGGTLIYKYKLYNAPYWLYMNIY